MKKQLKKCIACLLAVTTCLTSLNVSAFAADDEKPANHFGRGGAVTASSDKNLISSSISVDKKTEAQIVNEIAASSKYIMPEDIMLAMCGKTPEDFFGGGNSYIDQTKGQGVNIVPVNQLLEDNGEKITFADSTDSYNAYTSPPDGSLDFLSQDKLPTQFSDPSLYWFMQLYRNWAQNLRFETSWMVKNKDGATTTILDGTKNFWMYPSSFGYNFEFTWADLTGENWSTDKRTNYFISKLTDTLVEQRAKDKTNSDGSTDIYDNLFDNTAAGFREDTAILMTDILDSDVYNKYNHEGSYNFPIIDANKSLDTMVLDEIKGLSGYEDYNLKAVKDFIKVAEKIYVQYYGGYKNGIAWEGDRNKDDWVGCSPNSWRADHGGCYKGDDYHYHVEATASAYDDNHKKYKDLADRCKTLISYYESGNYEMVDEIVWFMWVIYGASTPYSKDFINTSEYDYGNEKRYDISMNSSFFWHEKGSYSWDDVTCEYHPTENDGPSLDARGEYLYMSDFREYLIRTNMYYNKETGRYTLDSKSFKDAYYAWLTAYFKDNNPDKNEFFETNVKKYYPYLYNKENGIEYEDASYAFWGADKNKQPDMDKAILFMNALGMDPGDATSYLSNEQRMDLQYCTDTKITESSQQDEYQVKRIGSSETALQRYEWYIYYNENINGGSKDDAIVVYHATTTQKTCPFTPVETGLYWVDCYQSYSVKYTENIAVIETDMLLETRTQTILTSMTSKRYYPIAEKTVVEKVLLESDEDGIKITESAIRFKIREGRVATTFATERLPDPIN